MEGDLATRLAAPGPVVGNWLSLDSPTIADVYAELGADFVLIDTEHTPLSLETVAECVRAVDAAGTETNAVVRVPDANPTTIKRVLDLGVDGLMVPMVETPADARAVVEATRYPPEGIRGVGVGRANRYGLGIEEALESAGDRLTTIVQIETGEGVENAPAIAAVDGVDSLFVGPADLSTSFGSFGDWTDERFEESIDRVIDASHDADLPIGTLAIGDEQLERWAGYGFDYVIVGYDVGYLIDGSRRARETYLAAIDEDESGER
ncbi:HpcH/HpaI aldolase family protein [Natronorarus salvus]|uniref:HpcH/HpaI aldolase family protein n=1 Tax=Natronorarus salvus TaxID=3117733 RepID=UPI002F264869